jgi:hypothetical protein
MLLFAILIVPLVLAGIAAGARDMRSIGRVNALGHGAAGPVNAVITVRLLLNEKPPEL